MAPSEEGSGVEFEFYGDLADVLMALSEIASGRPSIRIESDRSDDHPFGALVAGLNETFAVLDEAKERTVRAQKELEEKVETIDRQNDAIRDLSTPVMQVWDGVLCLPVVGVIDTVRSSEMTDAVLNAIVEHSSRFVIIDITGIEVMDTRTADHFMRMARAVQLLGSECALSGVSPAIAQTLVHLGTTLGSIQTHRTLRDALRYCVKAKRKVEV